MCRIRFCNPEEKVRSCNAASPGWFWSVWWSSALESSFRPPGRTRPLPCKAIRFPPRPSGSTAWTWARSSKAGGRPRCALGRGTCHQDPTATFAHGVGTHAESLMDIDLANRHLPERGSAPGCAGRPAGHDSGECIRGRSRAVPDPIAGGHERGRTDYRQRSDDSTPASHVLRLTPASPGRRKIRIDALLAEQVAASAFVDVDVAPAPVAEDEAKTKLRKLWGDD